MLDDLSQRDPEEYNRFIENQLGAAKDDPDMAAAASSAIRKQFGETLTPEMLAASASMKAHEFTPLPGVAVETTRLGLVGPIVLNIVQWEKVALCFFWTLISCRSDAGALQQAEKKIFQL